MERRADKEDRERLEARFRDKYTRAFPSFKFYFDSIDPSVRNSLANRVSQLGAVCNFLQFLFFCFLRVILPTTCDIDVIVHALSHPPYYSESKISSLHQSPISSPINLSQH